MCCKTLVLTATGDEMTHGHRQTSTLGPYNVYTTTLTTANLVTTVLLLVRGLYKYRVIMNSHYEQYQLL